MAHLSISSGTQWWWGWTSCVSAGEPQLYSHITDLGVLQKVTEMGDRKGQDSLEWTGCLHRDLQPTMLEKVHPLTLPELSPSFPHSTPVLCYQQLQREQHQQSQLPQRVIKHTLYRDKSALPPGLHPTVAKAFEPPPTTNFSVEVIARRKHRGQRTQSIYRGGSSYTQSCCSWPSHSCQLGSQP